MNGINRRSQKVECIARIRAVPDDGIPSGNIPVPVRGRIYTVADFVDSAVRIGGVIKHVPGITLLEVETQTCCCCDGVLGWPIVGFRPVLEDKPSAEVTEMLERIKTEPIKAGDLIRPLVEVGRYPTLRVEQPWKFGR